MQKFDDTVITDNGLNLLTSVNGGDDKIKYTKAVLASDDLTQAAATAIQKITTLSVKMSSPISINSRINDTINLSASFTNAAITEDFDFYCIGWYAKGIKDSTEYLIAVSPSTVKQTMPAGSNNAATASIEPKYAMALSRNAEVVINADPAGSVTKEYVDSQINELKTQGIINNGSIVSTADDCNKMITTSYRLVKGSVPQNAPDGFSTSGQIIVYGNKDTTDGVTQLAYDDINGTGHVRSYNPTNNKWAEWDLVITKSQLNAVLPTDIARTGENNDFKGKNTFETDPVDKNGDAYGLAKDIATKVTDNGDNSIEINKQAVTPVRDNKNGSINFNSKDMTPADDSAVVHTTGDETIDGQKKFKTDPTDSAGNAYAKTVYVNQQLDKKVNVADMRKPASDVVGLEDVPQAVVHSELTSGVDLDTVLTPGVYPFIAASFTNYIDKNTYWGYLVVTSEGNIVTQTLQATGSVLPLYRMRSGYPGSWSPWVRMANDYSVAHLSGANNFDTIPTVNNNPLLLASSLPSDLARTGQAQTFTQPQTFSIAPTIKDASKDKGDNQAATMADLKSVEDSAWHPVSVSMANFTIENAFYKKDNTKMTYELFVIAKDDTYYANQKDVLFQDPNIHSFGDLNPDTVYGEFGLTYSSFSDTGKVITKCSTSGNKIYYENSYSGTGNIAEEAINICGYIHITGTFK